MACSPPITQPIARIDVWAMTMSPSTTPKACSSATKLLTVAGAVVSGRLNSPESVEPIVDDLVVPTQRDAFAMPPFAGVRVELGEHLRGGNRVVKAARLRVAGLSSEEVARSVILRRPQVRLAGTPTSTGLRGFVRNVLNALSGRMPAVAPAAIVTRGYPAGSGEGLTDIGHADCGFTDGPGELCLKLLVVEKQLHPNSPPGSQGGCSRDLRAANPTWLVRSAQEL